MSREQQQRILVVVLVILAVVVAWRFLVPLMARSDTARAQRETREAVMGDRLVEINVGDLQAGAEQTYTPGRNIFRYGQKRLPPPPPPPRLPPPPPPTSGPPSPPPPPPKPRPPDFKLPLIGIFGPESQRVAVFKDGEDIVNKLKDDVIEEKFVVHQINLNSVDIAFVGFPDEQPKRVAIGK